jgi:signal transduction histidine kinase
MTSKETRENRNIMDDMELLWIARWIYIAITAFVGLLSLFLDTLQKDFSIWYMLVLFVIALLNNLTYNLIKASGRKFRRKTIEQIALFQFVVDLMLVTTIIHLDGGFESISVIFYFFVIASASLIYGKEKVYVLSFLAAAFYVLMAMAEYYKLIPHYTAWPVSMDWSTHSMQKFIIVNVIVTVCVVMPTGFFIGYLSNLKKQKEKEAELEKERRIKESQSMEEIRSRLVTVVSHQFRTPLTHIKFALSDLREKKDTMTSDQNVLVEESWLAMRRMLILIDRILRLNDLEKGRINLTTEVINFSQELSGVVRSLDILASRKQMTIDSDLDRSRDIFVKGDRAYVFTVLESLVENAIDYGSENSAIEVGLSENGKDAIFHVRNTGQGIRDEDKEKIFNEFFRTESALKTETDKSGLSLYLAKLIIKKHDGEIWFESNKKETTFYVSLPLSIINKNNKK